MRITIRQKNLEITLALRSYIESKLISPVQKLVRGIKLPDLPILDLEVGRTTQHHHKGKVYRVAANLALNGKLIRAEAEDVDVHAACDLVEDELKREITHYKTRASSLLKRGARAVKRELRFDRAARLFTKGRVRNEGN